MEKLLTETEVAEFFSVKVATIQSWRMRGTGPALPWIKIGKAVRYRMTDVERIVAESIKFNQEAA